MREEEIGSEHINYIDYHTTKHPEEGSNTPHKYIPLWSVQVHKNFNFNYDPPNKREEFYKKSDLLRTKIGIPIGDNGVIVAFRVRFLDQNYNFVREWEITGNNPKFDDPFYGGSPRDIDGVYVNMSPTEVRRRYFPEDIQ